MIKADGPKSYVIIRGLLMWHSAYFAAALDPNSSFFDNGTSTLEIVEEIEAFDAFYYWLYTGLLKDPPGESSPAREKYLSSILLCKLWVFAGFRGIPSLGIAVIDMLHKRFSALWCMPDSAIRYIYKHTTPEANLRVYLKFIYARTKSLERFQNSKPRHTVNFLHNVLPTIATNVRDQRVTRSQWARVDRCQWHDHSGPGGRLRVELRQ